MQETQVQSLSQEDTPGGRNGNPLQCFLPRESCGQRSLVYYSPLGCKESVSSISIWNKHKWSRATQLAELEMHEWKISRNPWVKSMRFIGCHWDFILGCCVHLLSPVQPLQLHGLQHARLPYPSLSLRVCSNSCPLSPGDVIQPYCPLSSLSPPLSIFSSIRVFSTELALPIRWPKCWSFSISPSNEYSGLISFRIDWFDLLAIQGILKHLLQHHSSKTSVFQHSANSDVWSNSHIHARLLEKP